MGETTHLVPSGGSKNEGVKGGQDDEVRIRGKDERWKKSKETWRLKLVSDAGRMREKRSAKKDCH